jgi:peptide/nickel transport system permease protein
MPSSTHVLNTAEPQPAFARVAPAAAPSRDVQNGGAIAAGSGSRRRRVLKVLGDYPLGIFSVVVIGVVTLAAIFAPLITTHSPYVTYTTAVLQPPGGDFVFGTDNLGRDLFSRIVYGARVSLLVGFSAVALALTIATTVGLLSAFVGGWFDLIAQRAMDAMASMPGLILALTIVALLGPSLPNVILAIGLGEIPGANRIVRGSAMRIVHMPYIESARLAGATDRRIVWLHVFPNALPPLIIIGATGLGQAILAEAALSFLGLGVQPPDPSWGGMLSGASRQFMIAAPWLAIFPGIAISLTVLAWNLAGDSLRDILDPRLRFR